MNRLLHTPEGFRDIYREECNQRRILTDRITSVIRTYGYEPIETSTVEFFDIFGNDIGTTPSRNLFKFFDREGNTIVLRPDFTPSIARAVATSYGEDVRPIRLYYHGKTFVNDQSLRGRLRERTQFGAELIQEPSADGDAEILSLICRIFEAAGITDFKIGISHSDFFKALLEEATLSEEESSAVQSLITNRNYFGLEEHLEKLNLDKKLRELFLLMGPSYVDGEDLSDALSMASEYPRIHEDLKYLQDLLEVLSIYGVQDHISIDLGQISSFRYYTGITFSGYTFGSGEPVVRGGRYDALLSLFGKGAPSIGFGFDLDELVLAMNRQGIPMETAEKRTVLFYDKKTRKKAISDARKIREQGGVCELVPVTDEKEEELLGAYPNDCCIDERRQ